MAWVNTFAPAWAPTCVLEGLGFDAPNYGLPFARDVSLNIEHRYGHALLPHPTMLNQGIHHDLATLDQRHIADQPTGTRVQEA